MGNILEDIAVSTSAALGELELTVTTEEIARLIQIPYKPGFGHFAIPLFGFAKKLRRPPQAIAEQVSGIIQRPEAIAEVKPVSGFLNFWEVLGAVASQVLPHILELGDR